MTKDWLGNKNTVWRMLGASNHSQTERQAEDFYATDPKALELFAPHFPIAHKVWEPACGNGMLSEWLRTHGHDVLSTDLVNRGYGVGGVDFLNVVSDYGPLRTWSDGKSFDILTNPPYAFATEFILRALDLIPPTGNVIMFLKTTFMEGKRRKQLIYDINPPRFIFQYSERILCAKNGDFDHITGSAVAYAMYVWNKHNDLKGTEVRWV